MQKYLIYIIFLLLTACNSSNETAPDKNQNSSENNANVISNDFHVTDKSDSGNNIKEPYIAEIKTHKIKSISELWNTYKTSKVDAVKNYEEGNIPSMLKNYEISANAAIDLSREDLAAGQLNNIGHFSIELFTKKTDYQNRIQTLAITGNQIEKETYYQETKEIFKQHYKLLLDAEPHLIKASRLDRKYKNSERTRNIRHNLKFIRWVKKYLRDGLTQ